MKADLIDDYQIVQYLLGALPEEARERIEAKYLGDRIFYEHMLAIEDELIDDYLGNDLSPDQHSQFEKYYLATPGGRQKVAFNRAVGEMLAEKAAVASRVPSPPVAAGGFFTEFLTHLRYPLIAFAVLLLLAMSIWSVMETQNLRSQFDTLQAEQQALLQREANLLRQFNLQQGRTDPSVSHEAALQAQVRKQTALADELAAALRNQEKLISELQQKLTEMPKALPVVLSFVLEAGRAVRGRNNSLPRLALSDADMIEFQLDLEFDTEYQSYYAVLFSGDDILWSKDGLEDKPVDLRQGKAVAVALPAGILYDGSFSFELSGISSLGDIEKIAEYKFMVKRK